MLNPEHRLGSPLPRHIAVLRALQLGDLLCAVPALRALRRALPQAEITLVGLPWARSFTQRYPHLIDDFIALPGYPGLPEVPANLHAIPSFFTQTQGRKFDLAIQLHGSGELTNTLLVLLGARINAGFYRPGDYCPDPERFLPWPDALPEIERYLALMEHLGVPLVGTHLEFPLLPEDYAALPAIARSLRRGEYACVHPGARLESRRWGVESFACVSDALASLGLRVVLTGSAEEVGLTRAVAQAMHSPSLDLAGRTSLGGVVALLNRARLLICNDTGVSHIAAALRLPSIVVCCGSDPARWAPLGSELHRVVYHPIDCRPCAYTDCPIGHPCASEVDPEAVIEQAMDLIERAPLCAGAAA
jgi:ADP-heptose:LPS heptosyltransferase